MHLQLAGHTAVIVGGARGIGLAIAREFAGECAAVALVDRAPDVAGVATALFESKQAAVQQATVRPYHVDVTDYTALAETAARIRADFGRVDHLVFAVGIGSGKFGFPFWNLQPSDWPRVLEVNVLGAVNTLHAFVPYLRESQDATVLLIASVAGQIGSQTDPPYSASKAALINFAQCAARDLAPYNVRVNTLCPGMVQTALNRGVWEAWRQQQPEGKRKSYEEWTAEKIQRVVPLNRWQEPEDMAALAVFLASPRARNICGQTLNVDGGFVMHWYDMKHDVAIPVIGLLGGIGAGKSAVAAELVKQGGRLINADQFGHEALRQPDLRQRVVERFGREFEDAQGEIDRKKLGAKVFADVDELRALEAIVFPFIGARIREEIDQARRRDAVRFIVLDAAVMLEAGWNGACDKLVFVDTPRALRLERIQRQRAWTESDLAAREALQMPLDEKRRRADAIINNAGTPATLAADVAKLLHTWGLS